LAQAATYNMGYGHRHWDRLDILIAGLLGNQWGKPHRHDEGQVLHLHKEDA
jgi:hypothetical protein